MKVVSLKAADPAEHVRQIAWITLRDHCLEPFPRLGNIIVFAMKAAGGCLRRVLLMPAQHE